MPIDFLYVKFILWVMVGGLLISKLSTRRKVEVLGNRRERWSVPAMLLFIIPLIYWCANRSANFGDTGFYFDEFVRAPSSFSGISAYVASQKKDAWYYGFSAIIKCLISTNPRTYFAVIAAIQLLCLGSVYRKYSRNLWLSIFLFVASTDYTAWMFNGTRQFLAACITFTALPFIAEKKYLPSICIVLLASRFHQSALLMLPVIFIAQGKAWNGKTLLIALCTLVVVAFIDEFTGFLDSSLQDTQYKNVVSDWNSWDDDGTNILRVLVYAVPTVLAFFFKSKLRGVDNPLVHLCVNMSVISTGIYVISMFTSGIFIGRLPVYFSLYNYILLPWEIRHFFDKSLRAAVTVCTVGFYLAFYLYSYM